MLTLVATPIGNIDDVSPAMREAYAAADVVAAEDTRRFRALLARLGLTIPGRIVSYFDGNEASRAATLLDDLRDGKTVAVVTDAGMPVVSDPGFRLAELAIAAGIPVHVVPGPSAPLVALALSGLPSDRFAFEGFLPRKSGARRRRLEKILTDDRTLIFFEAPHRLREFLADLLEVFGDRRIAVCRELTKTYEEVIRGTVSEVTAALVDEILGEITIVVAGFDTETASGEMHFPTAVAKVLSLTEAGLKLKAAAAEVAGQLGLNKSELYDAAVVAKKANSANQ